MFGIKVEMQKLNEDGSQKDETESLWIVNLQESGLKGNVLTFETFEEADKTAKQMRLKSYTIEEL